MTAELPHFLPASTAGHGDVVLLLLDHNADLHVRNKDGWTALYCAETKSFGKVALILREHMD